MWALQAEGRQGHQRNVSAGILQGIGRHGRKTKGVRPAAVGAQCSVGKHVGHWAWRWCCMP